MTLRTLFALFALCLIPTAASAAQTPPVYKNVHAPLNARVDDLFRRLTRDERHSLLTGTYFTTNPIPRLGVPAMSFGDGGLGVRGGMRSTQGRATLFPAGVILGASWDPELARKIGRAVGEEAKNKGSGVNVLLGPDINIHRSPLGGRDGESYSEDPYLVSRLVTGYVQGLQSTGVGACIKHYVANNEEVDRGHVDVAVSQRALREIYLPAFEAGVKEGGIWTLMTAYNLVDGHHMSENRYLLRNVLKLGWGFDGMVTSDWGGVHSTVGAVTAGNDLEMPGPGYLSADELESALQAGQITEGQIAEADKRILRTVIRVGLLDGPHHADPAVVGSAAHRKLALEGAEQGMVLLKNAGSVLPFDAKTIRSIAVIGPCGNEWQMGAGGSAYVTPTASSLPLDGIRRRAGKNVRVDYVRGIDLYGSAGDPVPALALSLPDGSGPGLQAEYFSSSNLAGLPDITRVDRNVQFDWTDSEPDPSISGDRFCARWTGKLTAPETGDYQLTMIADDGCRLFIDGKCLIDQWSPTPGFSLTTQVNMVAGRAYDLRIEYLQVGGKAFCRFNWALPGTASVFTEAVAAAKRADIAVVVVGTGWEGEGGDRGTMDLPGNEASLIKAVTAANKRTVVVLNNGGPVAMSGWLDQTPAVVDAFFPGEAGGDALAAILFGDVNPCGKLPDTIGKRREDYPDYGNFPGTNGAVNYAEGIYVGYRHFDKENITPQFPFGYGLSYTTFRYGPVKPSSPNLSPNGKLTVTVDITNTGTRAGAEVAQLYIGDPNPLIDKPVRELKGFQKVWLALGQTKPVTFILTARSFAYCDVDGNQWKAEAGPYTISVASSSRDIRAWTSINLTQTYTDPIPAMGNRVGALPGVDLALGRPVMASSSESALTRAENAVDGDDTTRWGSAWSDAQWLAVDLGKPQPIGAVSITWEAAYATGYAIQVSTDGATWSDVYSTLSGKGGVENIKFPPVTARYVRLTCTRRSSEWGFSLYSFRIYSPART